MLVVVPVLVLPLPAVVDEAFAVGEATVPLEAWANRDEQVPVAAVLDANVADPLKLQALAALSWPR